MELIFQFKISISQLTHVKKMISYESHLYHENKKKKTRAITPSPLSSLNY